MSEKTKKYTNIGTVMVAKKKNPNDPNEKSRFYLKLEQQRNKDKTPYGDQVFPITLANGKILNDGDVLAMFSKKEKLDYQLENKKITQEKYDQLVSFLKYDVCLVEDLNGSDSEPKDDGNIPF